MAHRKTHHFAKPQAAAPKRPDEVAIDFIGQQTTW